MWILLSSTYVRDRMMIFFFPCISFVWFFSSYKCVCVCVCVCVWERERERESSIYFWFRVYVCVCVCVCVWKRDFNLFLVQSLCVTVFGYEIWEEEEIWERGFINFLVWYCERDIYPKLKKKKNSIRFKN